MVPYFEFQNAVKLLCGELALERIAIELELMGAERPLMLSDAVLTKIGTLAVVIQAMESEGVTPAAVFTEIPVDSSLAVVNKIAAFYREQGCDSIVAVGGGSVIDTAKGVRLVLSQNRQDILSLSGLDNLVRGRHIPFVVVPTTAGTGSECTGVAVIRNDDNGVKMEFLSPYVEPDVAVVDPRMTMGLPPKATATTGMKQPRATARISRRASPWRWHRPWPVLPSRTPWWVPCMPSATPWVGCATCRMLLP